MAFSSLKPSTKPMKRSGFKRPTSALTGTLSAESRQLARRAKQPKCKYCRQEFDRIRPGQLVCNDVCALALAQSERAKAERKAARAERLALRAQKEAAKPLKARLKLAERAVNRYVILRDYYDPCISCDKPSHWDGRWHASHFKSVGSNSLLRYHLWNINKSCDQCNWYKAGNITAYEEKLRLKIGDERVQWLKDRKNGTREYSAEYLDRLTRIFNKKVRRLIKRRGLGVGE